MSHLRFYLQHIDADDPDETERALQSRFVIAQMLASDDRHDEALAELRSILPAFRTRYGPGSAHVRNLERQITRLRLP